MMINKNTTASLPSSFKYKTVFEKGKPVHEKYDSFSIRHHAMDLSRRAKIFAPFDALKGFDEAISAKEIEDASRNEYGNDNDDMIDYIVFIENVP